MDHRSCVEEGLLASRTDWRRESSLESKARAARPVSKALCGPEPGFSASTPYKKYKVVHRYKRKLRGLQKGCIFDGQDSSGSARDLSCKSDEEEQ